MAKAKKRSARARASLRARRRRARAQPIQCGKVVDYGDPRDFDDLKGDPLAGAVELITAGRR